MNNRRKNIIAMVIALTAEYFILKNFINFIEGERKLKQEKLENERILKNIEKLEKENAERLDNLEKEIDEKTRKLIK